MKNRNYIHLYDSGMLVPSSKLKITNNKSKYKSTSALAYNSDNFPLKQSKNGMYLSKNSVFFSLTIRRAFAQKRNSETTIEDKSDVGSSG